MRETLEHGLPELGMRTDLIPRLAGFAEMVLERNQVMNLTAITEPRDVAALHLLDSLEALKLAGLERESVIDVGCGAGFPGVPLAIAGAELKVTLLDSLGKRIDFLREACGQLGLDHVECVHARAEEFAGERRETFDVAISRAVASLPVLCELCLPLVRVGGVMLAMKSTGISEELKSAQRAIRLLGGETAEVQTYTIPTTDVSHTLVTIRKVSPTPAKYPRRFAQIKKQPL
ncbi:MAG: 16S rRNA (guanine(527)-N(7))-methyltransferase RsmG [Oscillibacter sp.]|nr:16S rRNA (guanine(527)-N(7))-methyltransferase RsmG [Oscillibacter sp.]